MNLILTDGAWQDFLEIEGLELTGHVTRHVPARGQFDDASDHEVHRFRRAPVTELRAKLVELGSSDSLTLHFEAMVIRK